MNDYANLRALTKIQGGRLMVEKVDLVELLAEVDQLRAAAPMKKARAKKVTEPSLCTLPDWLPLEAWNAFLDMRKKIKKPATNYAQELLVKKLAAFYANDLDPGVILNQSIMNGWQDLYAPKDASTARINRGHAPVADQNRVNNVAALALLDQVNFDIARTIDECQ